MLFVISQSQVFVVGVIQHSVEVTLDSHDHFQSSVIVLKYFSIQVHECLYLNYCLLNVAVTTACC